MIMKTLIRTFILFFCITGLASCYAGIPLKSGKSENNQTYEVSYLFEHDGVKLLDSASLLEIKNTDKKLVCLLSVLYGMENISEK